jgi:hypothetical protein
LGSLFVVFVCPPEGGLGSSWLKHALKQRPPIASVAVVIAVNIAIVAVIMVKVIVTVIIDLVT